MRRSLAALALILSSLSASAQSEFHRATGGEIDALTKSPRPLSGTLSLRAGDGRGYGATLGGSLVRDRVWFFASMEQSRISVASRYGFADADAGIAAATMVAQLGDRQSLQATARDSRDSVLAIPTSFLSLRYTGIISDSMFVNVSVSRTATGE